jgi:hypothetical protein
MATVVVNRMDVEPAPPPAESKPSIPEEPKASAAVSRRDVEKALRELDVRRARVRAH